MTTIERRPDGSLLVSERARAPLGVGLIFGAILLIACPYTLWQAIETGRGQHWIAAVGTGIGLLACVVGLAIHERSTFVFDRSRQALDWRRERFTSGTSGLVPFRDIERIEVREEPTAEDPPDGLLLVVTRAGPIHLSNAPAPRAHLEEVADAIRAVLDERRSGW